MVYFDKEKGEFVWLHNKFDFINHDFSFEISKKTLSKCFLCISGTKHSKEEIDAVVDFCEKKHIQYSIIPASIPNNIEEQLRFALRFLNSQEAIKYGYDYAWIKRVIDKNLFVGAQNVKNKSFPSFISYVKSLDNNFDIASKTVLSKFYKLASDTTPNGELPWNYADCFNDRYEKNRRNKLASAFLEIMKEF